jgi:hypothetical protein
VPSVIITVDSGLTAVDVCAPETKMGQQTARATATIRIGISGLDADELLPHDPHLNVVVC